MPLYEYSCKRCGETFEVMQKFSADPLTIHEECGGEVERLISPPAFQFKGSGWYVTDYARNSGTSANAANGKTESADAKPEKKAESIPAKSQPASKSPSAEK